MDERGQLLIHDKFLTIRELKLPTRPVVSIVVERCKAESWPSILQFYNNLSSRQLTHLSMTNCQLTDYSLKVLEEDGLLKSQLRSLCLGKCRLTQIPISLLTLALKFCQKTTPIKAMRVYSSL